MKAHSDIGGYILMFVLFVILTCSCCATTNPYKRLYYTIVRTNTVPFPHDHAEEEHDALLYEFIYQSAKDNIHPDTLAPRAWEVSYRFWLNYWAEVNPGYQRFILEKQYKKNE